jgi:tetratricopeptide (TPR) repeat protein
MAWAKVKTAVVIGVSVLLAAGTTTVVISQHHPSQERLTAAREHYAKAMEYEFAHKYEAALTELNLALGLNHDYAEALFSRACLYDFDLPMNERSGAKAIADYSHLLKLEPRYESPRFNRALCYAQLDQPDKAIADYTMVIEGDLDFSRNGDGKNSQVASARHYRGRVYFEQKDFAQAAADFTEAIRLDPKIAQAGAGGRILLQRGQAYHDLKRYAEAQDDFGAYAQIDPSYSQLWQSWAWQLATCPDAQFRDGRKALEYALKTGHPETIAAAYAELGQFDKAVKWQKSAITLQNPNVSKVVREMQQNTIQTRLKLYESGQPFREN